MIGHSLGRMGSAVTSNCVPSGHSQTPQPLVTVSASSMYTWTSNGSLCLLGAKALSLSSATVEREAESANTAKHVLRAGRHMAVLDAGLVQIVLSVGMYLQRRPLFFFE